jgi:hypothetical protein
VVSSGILDLVVPLQAAVGAVAVMLTVAAVATAGWQARSVRREVQPLHRR